MTQQADVSGNWLYIYSGRQFTEKNPDITKVGKDDPFESVHCIRLNQITGVKIDYTYGNENIVIYANGHAYPIQCSFGERNCYRINTHSEFVSKLQNALGLSAEHVWDMNKRSEQTALASQRADELQDDV